MIKDRAIEDWQKRDVMEKILNIWLKFPSLRLNQLIINSLSSNQDIGYNIEDYSLIEKISEFAEKYKSGK